MKWHQNDKGNHILFDDHDQMRGTVFPHALAEGWAVVIDNCFLKGLWKTPEEAQAAAEKFAEEI